MNTEIDILNFSESVTDITLICLEFRVSSNKKHGYFKNKNFPQDTHYNTQLYKIVGLTFSVKPLKVEYLG